MNAFKENYLRWYVYFYVYNAGLEEAQAGIKIAGRNINNLRYADDTNLMAESEEELKSLLRRSDTVESSVIHYIGPQSLG